MIKKATHSAPKKRIAKSNPNFFKKTFLSAKERIDNFLERRPHRSFRITKRRDAIKGWNMPGYGAFAKEVWATIRANKGILARLGILYAVLNVIIMGWFGSQDVYIELQDALNQTSTGVLGTFWETVTKSTLLFSTLLANGLTTGVTTTQAILSIFLLLIFWMVIVWILRQRLAKNTIILRDALYNACGPFVGIFVIAFTVLVQLIPFFIAMNVYSAANATGFLGRGGVENMILILGVCGLLCLMSIYFVMSSFLALIVVMLPGMYPMRALRVAGDMVTGRRLKILFRMLAGVAMPVIVLGIIMIPLIILLNWLMKVWPWMSVLPIMPLVLLVGSTLGLIWVTSYTYLMYRRLVESDAKRL